MTDSPHTDAPTADPEPLVDTAPATPERTTVTYGILFVVLSALAAYFVMHALRR